MTVKTMILRFPVVVCILLSLFVSAAVGQDANTRTKLKWFGHAAFSITTPNSKVLLIDPWLANSVNPESQRAVASLAKVDYILITHGHRDHVGDAVEIARKTGAALIANPELASNLVKLADFPKAQAETDCIMGIGGEIRIADGESYAIDVALLNIGGHFGMEPKMAARAAQSVRAKLAIPHHYGTFPGITQNSTEFAAELKQRRVAFRELKPGETITFQGNRIIQQ